MVPLFLFTLPFDGQSLVTLTHISRTLFGTILLCISSNPCSIIVVLKYQANVFIVNVPSKNKKKIVFKYKRKLGVLILYPWILSTISIFGICANVSTNHSLGFLALFTKSLVFWRKYSSVPVT